ncbi:hypothetical protein CBL_05133 [Carabus blaptoides fortunei]
MGKGVRYHPEEKCWFKVEKKEKPKVTGSNSVIEVDLSAEKKKIRIATPLIKLKMLVENKIEIMETYDPGSQVSLINSKWIKIKDNSDDVNKIFLKSVKGVNHKNGLVNIKIFNIDKEVDIYIVEREDFEDCIIELDLIPMFKLKLNENLEVSQKIEEEIEKPKTILSEIKNEGVNCSVNFNEHVETNEFQTKIEH